MAASWCTRPFGHIPARSRPIPVDEVTVSEPAAIMSRMSLSLSTPSALNRTNRGMLALTVHGDRYEAPQLVGFGADAQCGDWARRSRRMRPHFRGVAVRHSLEVEYTDGSPACGPGHDDPLCAVDDEVAARVVAPHSSLHPHTEGAPDAQAAADHDGMRPRDTVQHLVQRVGEACASRLDRVCARTRRPR
jgi:hypothetical protein